MAVLKFKSIQRFCVLLYTVETKTSITTSADVGPGFHEAQYLMRGQDLILLVALCRQEVKFDVEHLRLLSAALDPQFLCDLHSLQDLR